MNIKGRPLAISVAASASILAVSALISSFFTRSQMENMFSAGVPNPSSMFQNWGLSLFGCFLGILVSAGGGALYAYLHNKQEPVSSGDAAIGGALSGGLAYAISSLVSALLTLSFMPQMFDLLATDTGGTMPAEMQPFMLIGGVIGAVFGICFAVVMGGSLGALGGFLTASLLSRSETG